MTIHAPITSDQLRELESRAEQHRAAAIEFWKILAEIKDKKLYLPAYKNFSSYVRARWSISPSHGYRQLTAAKVAKRLSPKGENTLPKNEAAARALAGAPEPVVEAAIARAIKESTGDAVRISAKHVQAATSEVSIASSPRGNASSDPPIDGRGKAVSDPVAAPAFAQTSTFKQLLRDTRRIKREILALAGTPLGREVRTEQIERAFRDITEALVFAQPFAVCPMGPNCGAGCKYCRGSRWIHKPYFDALPPELRS
jgi:hypothetical protein